MSDEPQTDVFEFIDFLIEHQLFSPDLSPKDLFTRLVDKSQLMAPYLTSQTSSLTLKLVLATHAMAAKIQAYYHYYNEHVIPSLAGNIDTSCSVWIHWGSKQYCSVNLPSLNSSSPW